ncbi:unnamed protein product [Chironomus riparius]|uniref:Uncharacterized protein n=1 Tax=Chironomus riparius TaxID=315576 RepID=A0A9N9RP62_9DIPT|nr:unnamed protein product [Chironomus riparius]
MHTMFTYRNSFNEFFSSFFIAQISAAKMFTLKKFLWFMELESGVNLIGYCGIFMSLLLAIAFLLTSAFNIHEVLNYLSTRFAVHHNSDLPALQIFIIFVLVIAALLVNVYISISVIRGVQSQNHKLFKPYLGVELLFIFLIALEALTSLKLFYLLLTVINCYLWTCVYSLYESYKIDSKVKVRVSTINQIVIDN